MILRLLVACALFAPTSLAQESVAKQPGQDIPTITLARDWPAANPQFYKVEVQSSGDATYTSRTQGEEEPYSERFTMSAANRERIFDLAEKLNHFQDNFDFRGHKIAQTGVKTLTYHDATHDSQTSYNWSQNPQVEQLTAIFQSISDTIEAGRRLRYSMQFDKLGVNHELEGMEHAAESGQMRELQVVAPMLQEIASNPAYMHIAQQRARHLLDIATR